MSLYANSAVVKKTIEMFCELKQCENCDAYFCELTNVGMWKCPYHPGKFDSVRGVYTCCGEKKARPHMYNPHSGYSAYMTWGPTNRFQAHPYLSTGCKKRDCVPCKDSGLDKEKIDVDGIACLVPYMDPPLKERPGFRKGKQLQLIRQEPHPHNNWHIPPLEFDSDDD